jgi:hypothetical protein
VLGEGTSNPGFPDAGRNNDILLINGVLKPFFITGITHVRERASRFWVVAIKVMKPITSWSNRMAAGLSYPPGCLNPARPN